MTSSVPPAAERRARSSGGQAAVSQAAVGGVEVGRAEVGRAAVAGAALGRAALGRAGEDLAAAWYEAHGYEVLARNWRCREGELDIVAGRDRLVVFCEVKARTSDAFGLPSEAVGPRKQARLRRLAALWYADQASAGGGGRPGWGLRGGPARFDVASVLAGVVEVVEGAF
jgi:putative endonuclease